MIRPQQVITVSSYTGFPENDYCSKVITRWNLFEYLNSAGRNFTRNLEGQKLGQIWFFLSTDKYRTIK